MLRTNKQVPDDNAPSDPQPTDHSPGITSEDGPSTVSTVLESTVLHPASTAVASPMLTDHGLTSDVVLKL